MFDCALSLAIRLASATVVVGWLLSACGELNGRGYLCLGVPIGIAIVVFRLQQERPRPRGKIAPRFRRWWKRRRALPLIYFFTLALIITGSILHEPNNFDGVSYREPKVLYWLDQQQWHWIDSPYEAMNFTLPNYEWLTVPLFLTTHGFHLTVVINWIALLLLPSLMFTLLRAFGAAGRAAFDWMWIFPAGYVIVTEAGGIGNDVLGLVALLAALHCANRFAAGGKGSQLFDALLAAGFCTGVKLSNLPLPFFVLILLLRNGPRLRARPVALAVGLALAAAVSALIPMVNNYRHAGTIYGTTETLDVIDNPAAGLVGNGLITLAAAFEPPMLPGAGTIMPALERGLGGRLDTWLHGHYGRFSLKFHELPQEEIGGLGIGITAALIINGWLWWRTRRTGRTQSPAPRLARWQMLAWSGGFAILFLALAAKLGTGLAFPRNVLPWYPVALAPLIAGFSMATLWRSRLWRVGAALAALSVLPAVFLSPARPLVPPEAALKIGRLLHLSPQLETRMRKSYQVYAERAHAFAVVLAELPAETRVLGLATDGSEPTASFWKPYLSHRCVYLATDEKMRAARTNGVEYFVVAENACVRYFDLHTDEFLSRYGARAVKSAEITTLVGQPATRYTLARFESPPPVP